MPPWRTAAASAQAPSPISGSHLRSHPYPCINHHLNPYLKNIYILSPVSTSTTILYPCLKHHLNPNP